MIRQPEAINVRRRLTISLPASFRKVELSKTITLAKFRPSSLSYVEIRLNVSSLRLLRSLNAEVEYLCAAARASARSVVKAVLAFFQIFLRGHFIDARPELVDLETVCGFVHSSALRSKNICLRGCHFARAAFRIELDEDEFIGAGGIIGVAAEACVFNLEIEVEDGTRHVYLKRCV